MAREPHSRPDDQPRPARDKSGSNGPDDYPPSYHTTAAGASSESTPLLRSGAASPTSRISTPGTPKSQRRAVDDDDHVQHHVTPIRGFCICASMWVLIFMQGKQRVR